MLAMFTMKRLRWSILLLFAGTGIGALCWEGARVLLGDNFHVVLPGKVYRGSQRSADDLEKLVKQYGIRTVVNLRGLSHSGWFVEQSRRVQKLDIDQHDLNLSASRLPPAQEMRRLVEIIDRAAYPIYFHCRRGADRTGLASVVAKILLTDCRWEDARSQLHWRVWTRALWQIGLHRCLLRVLLGLARKECPPAQCRGLPPLGAA